MGGCTADEPPTQSSHQPKPCQEPKTKTSFLVRTSFCKPLLHGACVQAGPGYRVHLTACKPLYHHAAFSCSARQSGHLYRSQITALGRQTVLCKREQAVRHELRLAAAAGTCHHVLQSCVGNVIIYARAGPCQSGGCRHVRCYTVRHEGLPSATPQHEPRPCKVDLEALASCILSSAISRLAYSAVLSD